MCYVYYVCKKKKFLTRKCIGAGVFVRTIRIRRRLTHAVRAQCSLFISTHAQSYIWRQNRAKKMKKEKCVACDTTILTTR